MTRPTIDGSAIFGAALRLMRENKLLLAGLPFVINLGLTAITALFSLAFGASTMAVDLLLPPLVSGIVTLVAADLLAGQRVDLSRAWARIATVFVPLVALSFVATVASILGMLALIVPGLYIGAVMLPLVSVIVLENAGWGAIGRTYDMAQPVAWPLVGIVLRLTVLALVAILPLSVLITVLAGSPGAPLILLNGLMIFAASTIGATVSVTGLLVYQVLRGGSRDVAEVFR